jgi:tryptophan synthase alpha chain
MSLIKDCFSDLQRNQKKALITFITAGDPVIKNTVPLMHALVNGGADILELGVPFSDPMADGEVIQRASERSLVNGTSLDDVIDIVKLFRRDNKTTPVVLMGYYNPFQNMSHESLAAKCLDAGVDGILVVDLPPDEAEHFNAELVKAGVDQIFLVAPNSPEARIRKVCQLASGFVYFVSVKGVTGGKSFDAQEISASIARTKEISGLPVGLGFGIKSAEAAAVAATISDGVVIGSAIVELVAEGGDVKTITQNLEVFVGSIREAIDNCLYYDVNLS